MKFIDSPSLIAFFVYFVILAIVNGQPATDHKDEIAQLRAELARSVGRIGKLEKQLAASVDIMLAELHGHFADKIASMGDELTQLKETVSGKKSLPYYHISR